MREVGEKKVSREEGAERESGKLRYLAREKKKKERERRESRGQRDRHGMKTGWDRGRMKYIRK